MWMIQLLEHLQFIIDHLFIALDALLENDLDGAFLASVLGLSNDAICSSSQCPPESILRLFIVAVGLALKLVQETCAN